ncbi:MAG: hypothetical protein JWP12_1560 [Bacteroidetes bacterium]|nr:hypothetical protein [Bacteroidota bacterium]
MGQHTLGPFNLDHPFAIIFTLLPALINFAIFLYVSFSLPKNKLTATFSLFVLMLAVWQLIEGISHNSISSETAAQWFRISGIPTTGVMVFEVFFALQLAGWYRKVPPALYYIFLILPGFLFLMQVAGRLDNYDMSTSSLWNWIASPTPSVSTDLFYLWISLMSMTTLVIFFLHYLNVRTINIKRQQAFLLLIGFSIPVVGGIIGEMIIPLYFHHASIPVTTPLITAFSIAALIAIKRYGLLEYSPIHQWEKVLKNMSEGVIISDNEGKIVYANEKFCELLNYSSAELMGRTALSLISDATSRIIYEEATHERQSKTSSQYQVLVDKKGDGQLWVNANGFPYLDKAGNVVGSVGVVTDVTELMKTQLELRKKNNDLNVFFYKTAHDFKTPIASMQGLLEYYSKDDNIEELLHYIKLCVKNLSLIVSRVSQLSVIQQQKVITAEIDCSQQVERLLRELENENPNFSDVKIIQNIECEKIVSELFLLNSILKNLIDNSIKYADPDKTDPFVSISIREHAGMYELIVKDNGQGIPQDIQEKIFDMFYRGNDKSKGAGLGLYIVKSAVEKLNGSISVKSGLKEGSEFTVLLLK